MARSRVNPAQLLKSARDGDVAARGHLLELYRNYLRLMARSLIGQALRVRLDPSDLVQETFLKAHRDFPSFVGTAERQFVAWLRMILVRNLADQVEHHQAQARDHRREEPLEEMLERSSLALEHVLATSLSAPSVQAARREQAVLLADALACLPPDYREVFTLRSLEHTPVQEIAVRMGRSVNAIHKLWARAMAALVREMEA
jgi:RNA polymerase sigma-70 factor (ECF subfamily)